MKATSWLLLAFAASLASVPAGAAQSPPARFRVTPLAAHFNPVQNLPPLTGEGGLYGSGLRDGLGVGASAEWRSPLAGLALRATALRVHSELAVGQLDGARPTDGITLDLVAADLVIGLPAVSRARPFLAVGAGRKWYDFSGADDAPADVAGGYGLRPDDPTLHLGVGVDWAIGRYALGVELGGYESTFTGAGRARSRQHDFVTSVGVRVPLF